MIAGFKRRGAGLLFAIDQSYRLLLKILSVRGTDQPLELSPFDFVNLLGIKTYERVVDDHANWMNELQRSNPSVIQKSGLLQFFRDDFEELANVHDKMERGLLEAQDSPRSNKQENRGTGGIY